MYVCVYMHRPAGQGNVCWLKSVEAGLVYVCMHMSYVCLSLSLYLCMFVYMYIYNTYVCMYAYATPAGQRNVCWLKSVEAGLVYAYTLECTYT
jgi:hypothetical protein